MKDHRILDPKQESAAEEALFGAILCLESLHDCRAFFRDLCTPAELQALKDRWAVAQLLTAGLTYRAIHERTGVSITTIGRVARFLTDGTGGYNKVLERIKKHSNER
jgi:TrpR-related protein YerC/YecD